VIVIAAISLGAISGLVGLKRKAGNTVAGTLMVFSFVAWIIGLSIIKSSLGLFAALLNVGSGAYFALLSGFVFFVAFYIDKVVAVRGSIFTSTPSPEPQTPIIMPPSSSGEASSILPSSVAKRCPKCTLPNPADAKFCFNCGQSLRDVITKLCPNCSHQVMPGQKYCTECGSKLA